jgi:hypothetical protein
MRILISSRIVVLALLFAVACSGCVSITSAAPSSITCHTQYRPDAETLEGAREPSLTVERADDLSPQPQTLEFATLTLEVTYHGDAPEGRNVTVVVTTPDGQPLVRDLYQLTDGGELRREFAGGHGFTGLQYVFHEGASLQVWCTAADT